MKGVFTAIACAAALTFASAADYCGQWDSATAGRYIVYNNLWNMSAATSGSQCTGVDSISGSSLAWHTSYSWAGGPTQVKSYASAALVFDKKQLKSITTIPTIMKYKVTNTGTLVADVAYDLFTSSSANGENEYEIMIWLAALGGAGPISSTGSTPIAVVTIGGNKFNLFKGPNGKMTVFSFVATKTITSFTADLMKFINYVTKNQGLPTSQYLIAVQAGTEPFIGKNVKLAVSSYAVAIK
ncbi:hypothetical protein BBJ28_00007047 [Nothophytophthora sp. Chile5]|nr:hypothetical protein BBJ28_00007047 [Nothophytophthora sp. Chile5]